MNIFKQETRNAYIHIENILHHECFYLYEVTGRLAERIVADTTDQEIAIIELLHEQSHLLNEDAIDALRTIRNYKNMATHWKETKELADTFKINDIIFAFYTFSNIVIVLYEDLFNQEEIDQIKKLNQLVLGQ
ncbi:MAG: hypothetical protein PUE27_10750 [Sharpea porci]|uniref:hypothetical protein n=1 Tax=Sharpea porci TaxID=2652286 RepID=UPI0024090BF8|nr:hypothetical protein [Sharpea porci]MDD6712542.1 hypothetical protein [Sharpea porci]